jgi:hypothetical protein
MPIYLHISNVIILKEAVQARFKGGEAAFRQEFFDPVEANEEDDELFLLAGMGLDEDMVDGLIEQGLRYDDDKKRSPDFAVYGRHQGFYWPVDWARDNGMYVWHVQANELLIERAQAIANTRVDELVRQSESGEDPFPTLRLGETEE